MLTQEENELLCRVEGDAPMGQIMRRHWLPACLIEEVEEPDCDPVKVRLCGTDLVVFRDTNGKLGVLDELCPHRRASLVFGRNEECGIRCLYHGWKFDVDGNAMELASEPAETGFIKKVKTNSYPVREAAGFVWVYLGPAEMMPEFEPPVFQPDARHAHLDRQVPRAVQLGADSRRRHRLGALLDLHSSDMVPARVAGAEANDKNWLRPQPTSRRACRFSARRSASVTPRCAVRSRTPRRTIISARRSLLRRTRSTFRRTTTTRSRSCTCRSTTRTRTSTSCASAILQRRRRPRPGGSSSARPAASI